MIVVGVGDADHVCRGEIDGCTLLHRMRSRASDTDNGQQIESGACNVRIWIRRMADQGRKRITVDDAANRRARTVELDLDHFVDREPLRDIRLNSDVKL